MGRMNEGDASKAFSIAALLDTITWLCTHDDDVVVILLNYYRIHVPPLSER